MVQISMGSTYRVPNTLPSDTEESVLGTEWHQEAIGARADILRLEEQLRRLQQGLG